MRKILFILIITFFIACEGPIGPNGKDGLDGIDGLDGGYDKQLRITFPFEYWGTESTNWEIGPEYTYLTRFNKASFVNVDSILFVVPFCSDLGIPSTTDSAFVELYNLTDSEPIENSRIRVVAGDYTLVESKNIYSDLPSYEITLAIRLRRSDDSGICYMRTPRLILYRQ